ncbi:MAG: hypothetical protein KatS3mg054_0831 [Chloroflexus sp.]|nr:MAG: hypothetical protein KatS3mg054_0831 [Chloroflexus sp.]GIV93451.1 MAG: hypothetical protein KatS3mg056_2160 [Chloroflexus sp.]
MQSGTIVRCRKRDWALLLLNHPDIVLLRPLVGASDQVVAMYRRLADLVGYDYHRANTTPSLSIIPPGIHFPVPLTATALLCYHQ